ncbi:YitT family protein [Paenibacillus sp. N1-5-1-14]|uniref:YitT family protein n=1 Tax=Paenibacillus radicibacter TaxID=2972488 RepID=UPI0021595988|nr:YitT family protein [Paenibacillus radicibacter]MCR8645029.1 YitT family protein [Paenibacillus radicibacter]
MAKRQTEPRIKPGSPMHTAWEYAQLTIGCFVLACAFNMFLNPNKIASGGISGVSTILQVVFGFEPAMTQWFFNIPLFILGAVLLGKKYGIKVAAGTVLLPFFVLMTKGLPVPTSNMLLASVYGGIGVGLGVGITFRGRGSTGGFTVAAQIVHKYTGRSLGVCVAMFDGLVILMAGILISWENALYALIGLYVTSKVIDIVQVGLSVSKVAYIITDKQEEMKEAILYDLDRGLTQLEAAGGYTGTTRNVFMVVVSQSEVMKLKVLVKAIDPQAFVIFTDAQEVLGEGFKHHHA